MSTAVEIKQSTEVTKKEQTELVLKPEKRWEAENYIALEDFAKFGKRSKHWSFDDFYEAMHNLTPHKKDKEGIDNPRVCKQGRRHIPCFIHNQDVDSASYKEGYTTTYFIKGKGGHWAFRYDNFPTFRKRYFKKIDKMVNGYVAARVAEKEAQKAKKQYMREHGLKTEAEFLKLVPKKG